MAEQKPAGKADSPHQNKAEPAPQNKAAPAPSNKGDRPDRKAG